MLDSIRSSLLGRAHYPHQHFMATGAHSITLVTHGKNEKDNSGRIRDFIWILVDSTFFEVKLIRLIYA